MKRLMLAQQVFLLLLICITLLLNGCSATVPPGKALHPVEKIVHHDEGRWIKVADPIEKFNRRVYRFNYYFDRYVFLPIVAGYQLIMPDFAENRVSNFLDNVLEVTNLSNSLLQLKPKESAITLARVVTNSTLGLLGLFDPATGIGLPRQDEDFGQTLGFYGISNGPYLVLPLLGPSNLRDTVGMVGDSLLFNAIDLFDFKDSPEWSYAFTGVYAIDKRKRVRFRYYASGTPFEYEWIRFLYSQKRSLQIQK